MTRHCANEDVGLNNMGRLKKRTLRSWTNKSESYCICSFHFKNSNLQNII